ncbi:MAG: UbiA family prenyltransferase [Promethearchaeota archaeon]
MVTLKKRIYGHLVLVRPLQLFWLDIVAGFSGVVVLLQGFPDFSDVMFFFVISLLADAGACTFNDIADIEVDSKSIESRRFRPLVVGTVSVRSAWIQGLLLYCLSAFLAFFINPTFFLLTILMLIWAFQYSFPPLRLTGRPYISQVYWVVFVCLWIALLTSYLELPFIKSFFDIFPYLMYMMFYLCLGETMAKDIRDWDNDKSAGKNTTTVVIGPARASDWSFGLGFLGCLGWFWAAISYKLHFFVIIAFGAIAIPTFYLFYQYRSKLQVEYNKIIGRHFHVTYLLSMALITILTTFSIGFQVIM